MTQTMGRRWEARRTDETRSVEDALRNAGFDQVDAYRYNSASIRVRVIDSRFEGRKHEERDALIEPSLAKLPDHTQADIVSLFAFSSTEIDPHQGQLRQRLMNLEFEEPSPSLL